MNYVVAVFKSSFAATGRGRSLEACRVALAAQTILEEAANDGRTENRPVALLRCRIDFVQEAT